ncbi:MAG: MFS transporter [Gemmataceae bacterium]
MSDRPVIFDLARALREHAGCLLGVVPGVALATLDATMLDVPAADVIAALDSDRYRIHWIQGSYLIGAASGMALTRFLSERFGLRLCYLWAAIVFTLAATACGFVSEVIWMTPLRLLQGLGNGLLISSGMVLLWRELADRKELAMAMYGMGLFLAAMSGAVLGGMLTSLYSWRLIFWIHLPLGVPIVALSWWLLKPDRPEEPRPGRFDWFGLALLIAWVLSLNVVLDMGQYWGWLNSPFFAPWFVALLFTFTAFVAWGIWGRQPLINMRPFAIRNYGLALAAKALFAVNLYVLLQLLSSYMINLRGYQWHQAALVILPATVGMLLGIFGGMSIGVDANRKARMASGLLVMSLCTWQLADIDLYTSKYWTAAILLAWSCGAGVVIGPALLTMFEGLKPEQTAQAAGVFNIMRSLPAFLVGATLMTLLTQSSDEHFDYLRRSIQTNRPIVTQALQNPAQHFVQRGSPPRRSEKQAHTFLGQWVHANAKAYAFQDVLLLLALAPALAAILILFVRIQDQPGNGEPRAENGD